MASKPYATTVFSGYTIEVEWEDKEPPEEAINCCFTYEKGYWKVSVHVTPDNLSVPEMTKIALLVFPVESEMIEEHGHIATIAYSVFPIEVGQKVSDIWIQPDQRKHEGILFDHDRLTFSLTDNDGFATYSYFCLYFTHIKQDIDFMAELFG